MSVKSRVGRLEKGDSGSAPEERSRFERMIRYQFIDPVLSVVWSEFLEARKPLRGEPAPIEVQAALAKRVMDRINQMREEDYGEEDGMLVYRPRQMAGREVVNPDISAH